MKSIFAYSLLIALMLLPVLSYVLWQRQPEHIFNIAIIDKTIKPTGKNKHSSIAWVLKHNNYRKVNGFLYNSRADYYGLFPSSDSISDYRISDLEQSSLAHIDSLAEKLNAIYCADTYGTYYNDWYPDSVPTETPIKLYGGLSYEDLYLIEQMKLQGKLVIAEQGMLSPPTPLKIRKLAEHALGIKYSGWSGCFFPSLDTAINKEIPKWALDLQKIQYIVGWHYSHAGIILVHESGKILILEDTKELARAVPTIYTTRYCRQQYGTAGSVHFPYWFEISEPTGKELTTIAYFNIHTNPIGDSLLKMHKIPVQFPAIIEHKGSYWMHYYAGDFSALTMKQTSASFMGIEKIGKLLYDGANHSGEKFFWTLYRPLLGNVFQNYLARPELIDMDSLLINTAAL